MELLTKENFEFAIVALLPGFIALACFLMAFRTRMPSSFYTIVLSVGISFFYINLLALGKLALDGGFASPKPLADFVNFIILPAILGYLVGVLWEWLSPKLRSVGIPVRSPIPTAWDFAFAKRSHCWVLVRFKSDREAIKGWYCGDSFVGTELRYRDIFLTQVHEYQGAQDSNEGGWYPCYPPLEVWINGDDMLMIEFDNGHGEEQNHVKTTK